MLLRCCSEIRSSASGRKRSSACFKHARLFIVILVSHLWKDLCFRNPKWGTSSVVAVLSRSVILCRIWHSEVYLFSHRRIDWAASEQTPPWRRSLLLIRDGKCQLLMYSSILMPLAIIEDKATGKYSKNTSWMLNVNTNCQDYLCWLLGLLLCLPYRYWATRFYITMKTHFICLILTSSHNIHRETFLSFFTDVIFVLNSFRGWWS